MIDNDVKHYAAYHIEAEKQHEVINNKLEASQTTILERNNLRSRMLQKAQAFQSQIQEILLVESQRLQQAEANIQELQESVQTLTHNNTELHLYVELQHEEDLEHYPK